MSENVVFLTFDNKNVASDEITLGCCTNCRNKTYKIVHDKHDYPLLQCAACGCHISRFGWVHDE